MSESLKDTLRRINRERLRRRNERLIEAKGEDHDYARWLSRHDSAQHQRAAFDARARRAQAGPVISVLMPSYNPDPRWLDAAIDSVCAQVYPRWELCIADDCSTDPRVRELLERRASEDPRIRVTFRDQNGHISAASNTALAMARGEFFALLDHDDQLPPHALLLVAEAIAAHPDADLFYSDEDKIDDDGQRRDAYFKPDWNPELFRGHNVFSHLGVYRTSLVRRMDGFRAGFEGSQDYDLALRCVDAVGHGRVVHIPHVLYHWRVHEGSTSAGVYAKPYAMEAGRRALLEHLARQGVDADVVPDVRGWYAIEYKLPRPAPRVAVIILDGHGKRHLRKCRALLERTAYPDFTISVADGAHPMACNDAVAAAGDAEFIALLDSRCRAHAKDWLRRLVAHAAQPGVGAVGPKLIDEHGRVAGSAVVLGPGGTYAHFAGGIRADAAGYCGRASIAQDVSALDEGCMVVRRSTFLGPLGFDPTYEELSAATVDFTLKLRARGFANRWVPAAWMARKPEPALQRWLKTRARNACRRRLASTWNLAGANDPAHNPNLGWTTTDVPTFAHPPRSTAARSAIPL